METEQDKKEALQRNGFKITIGLHGQIFVTPFNKNLFTRSFESIEEAYNYYKNYIQQ